MSYLVAIHHVWKRVFKSYSSEELKTLDNAFDWAEKEIKRQNNEAKAIIYLIANDGTMYKICEKRADLSWKGLLLVKDVIPWCYGKGLKYVFNDFNLEED